MIFEDYEDLVICNSLQNSYLCIMLEVIPVDAVERIFSLMAEKKMEQKEFAAKIGVSENVVSTWRTGRTKSYTRYIFKIANALDTTTDYLLYGKETFPAEVEDPEWVEFKEKFQKLTSAERKVALERIDRIISNR